MTVTAEELKEVLSKNPDVVRAAMASDPEFLRIVRAGKLAVAREKVKKRIRYARGKKAAVEAQHDETITAAEQEHVEPLRQKKVATTQAADSVLARLDACKADLDNDQETDVMTEGEIDAEILGIQP